MAEWWWILTALVTVALLAGLFVWSPIQSALRDARLADARRDFHLRREGLEAKFVQIASAQTKVNAPHWDDCQFDDDVAYVRNRGTGELAAFVAITIALDEHDPLEPSATPDGNLRAGTAVFRLRRGRWETDGQALLNLSPAEAVRFYQNDLEVVAHELAH